MGCDHPQAASAECSICPIKGRDRLLVTRTLFRKHLTLALPTSMERAAPRNVCSGPASSGSGATSPGLQFRPVHLLPQSL